ncbi:hypothetical protein GCM10029976_018440 [Kribbella albertanoniae]|uniref:LamG-like jellyroll fold domain-containing protein n=1 Tax=Kribbella albertanoniae TaxID=1266829 RepID=A0A4R4PBY5_9ACTN|nr:LamG domain-containing protein [Kribbella albertanoniae]TDC18527.1 hypothetical protein E1261_35305 [Kribbella albertanoniae]
MRHARLLSRLPFALAAAFAVLVSGLPGAAAADPPVPLTPPTVTATYKGEVIQNCWDQQSCPKTVVLGEAATFTFAPTSADVTKYTYRLPGGNPVTVEGASVTVDIEPLQQGRTNLQVSSINSIGQPSNPTYFMFNVAAPPGPVGSWNFDEGSGTTAADGPGLTHPLALSGAAFEASGRINGALALDGVDDYASATEAVVDTSKSFSISTWARPANPSKLGVIASVNGANSSAAGLGYDPAAKRWVFARSSADVRNPTIYRAVSKDAPVNESWSQLIATYDATSGTLKLYVNGRLQQETVSPPANAWKASGTLSVGRGLLGGITGGHFRGSLDHLQIWQRVLRPEELVALQTPRPDDAVATAVAAHWPLDNATRGTDRIWRSPDSIRDADLSVSGFPGTDQSKAFVDDPEHGKVLELTGATRESVSLGRPVVDASASFAVAVWVKIADPSKPATIIRQGTGTSDTWRLSYEPGDEYSTTWNFTRTNVDGTETTASGSADRESVDPGQWHLLVGEYRAQDTGVVGAPSGSIYLSIDHHTKAVADFTAPRRDGSTTLGKPGTTGAPFAGRLDDVRIYVGDLSPTSLCADYPDPRSCAN